MFKAGMGMTREDVIEEVDSVPMLGNDGWIKDYKKKIKIKNPIILRDNPVIYKVI